MGLGLVRVKVRISVRVRARARVRVRVRYPNPDHLLRDPKVEVINAWRDVGRELVRLCQVQHAAASATKERVKSLLPRHPVPTWNS